MINSIQVNWQGGATWVYKGTIAQVVGAPASIGMHFNFLPGTQALLQLLRIQVGSVGAPRVMLAKHSFDLGAATTLTVLGSDTLDSNQTMDLPIIRTVASTITQTTNIAIGQAKDHRYDTGYLFILGTSLANLEVITVTAMFTIKGRIPATTVVGAAVTLTEVINQVV